MATSIRRTTTIARTVNLSVVPKHQSGVEYPNLLTDLFTAYYCARKNKRNTSSQVRFERNISGNLMRLYDDIVSGRYRVGRSMCFVIREPVLREVFAASFRDRIVHHLLYNWLMPIFEPTFIYDSYSCREGKGTLFGIKRLEHHIRSCSDNYRRESYVLKLDIEGYFMNISRQRLYDVIESRLIKYSSKHSVPFDLPLTLRLLSQVIFNEPTKGCYRKGSIYDWDALPHSKSLFYAREGCGLPIGNLTSQLFSNIYLSALDEYIKRELKCRHYGRYVDDFYIVGNSPYELLALIPLIRNFLASRLGLKLHPRKIHITTARKGVRFLGAVVKLYQRYIYQKSLSRLRSKLLCCYVGEVNPYRIIAVQESCIGYLSYFSGVKH